MGRKCIAINQDNCSFSDIAEAKQCAASYADSFRLDAIEYLLRGYSRKEVCELRSITPRTLREWVKKFNSEGIDGLVAKARPGRARKLEMEYFKDIAEVELSGDCATVVQLHGYLTQSKQKELSYSTCWRYTREAGYRLIVPRKINPKSKLEEQEEFIEKFNQTLSSKPLRVFFCDEAGFEGDPRPCRRWNLKGTKPRLKNDGLHVRQSVIGAVSPSDGELFSIVVPFTNTEVFQTFLDLFSKKLSDEQVYLVLDNAAWHHVKTLNWHNFIPIYLPPYSPELNTIEQLWKCLKKDFFSNWYSRDEDILTDRICTALLSYYDKPDKISSICAIHYLNQ